MKSKWLLTRHVVSVRILTINGLTEYNIVEARDLSVVRWMHVDAYDICRKD